MTHSPDVLTLLLKRFTFDYKQNRYIKLQCKADVAQTLHIQVFHSLNTQKCFNLTFLKVSSLCLSHQGCTYELYAVVHHFGDLTGGLYTAEIKSFETGRWYCFNDSIVKRVSGLIFLEMCLIT